MSFQARALHRPRSPPTAKCRSTGETKGGTNMEQNRNNKMDGFPPIQPRPLWVEFVVGFCSGVASTVAVGKGAALVDMASMYGSTILVWLIGFFDWWHPPPLNRSLGWSATGPDR